MNKIYIKYLLILVVGASFWSCKQDEFDGLLNIDPAPAVPITFPQAVAEHGFPIQEDNAYIIKQNSVAAGQVSLVIRVPEGQQIQSISVAGQRYRGAITAPNNTPAVPTSGNLRMPAAFGRTTAPNLVTNMSVTPSNEVTYSIPVNSLPAAITNADLGAVQANDTFRFFVWVTLADGSVHRAIEARIVVTG